MSFFSAIPKVPSRSEFATQIFGSSENFCQKGNTWFLACSGGLDSMVLLFLAADYAKRSGQKLEVVHVNYGLRGEESDEDARFVQSAAKALGLSFHLLKADANPKGKVGIQEWARQLRYDWFFRLAKDDDKILLAHHQDDLIETILMRIMRGSSLHGLMGMKKREGKLFRPLLDISRSRLEAFAKSEGIEHREDSSNATLDYSRNRLRSLILPELDTMFPGARQNLFELAASGQQWTEYFQKTITRLGEPQTPSEWKELGFYPAAQLIVSRLDNFLNGKFSATKPSRRWLESLYVALSQGTERVFDLGPEIKVHVREGSLDFERKDPRAKVSARWLQYEAELTKSDLIACLSPGSRLDLKLDEGLEMQDNENAGFQKAFRGIDQ